MWKILLADDEAVIVRGLRRLIDWEALHTRVVGEATDGEMAARLMEELRPDLVISDIRMPGLTGLELMERFRGEDYAPKFLFISGYEEFSYVRQALSGGAVDYLLKPVRAQDLEAAVRKALGMMADSSAAALLRPPEGQLQDFFRQITADRAFTGSELCRKFRALVGDRAQPVFAGLCFGLPPQEEARLEQLPYERRLLQKFMAFNAARDQLERSGSGCFLRKDDSRCCLMGIFSPEESVEERVAAVLAQAEEKTGYRLRVGVGRPCRQVEELAATLQEAEQAFELYYFKEEPLLVWDGAAPPPVTNEDFDQAVKAVFRSIVAKSDGVLEAVDRVMDAIAALHYGNRGAAFNRTMLFTGDLCQQLFDNHLLTGSFAQRQDALQHALEDAPTFGELRRRLRAYYQELLPHVYHTARGKSTTEICRVRQYIEEHYDREISLKTLAELACVSPSYFSAYFKAETGQNYKAYLTGVRMEQAMHLVMSTDLKAYEIAERVGYNNVRRFVDAFRAAYQMSPTDYRKLHRKGP